MDSFGYLKDKKKVCNTFATIQTIILLCMVFRKLNVMYIKYKTYVDYLSKNQGQYVRWKQNPRSPPYSLPLCSHQVGFGGHSLQYIFIG